MLHRAFCLLPSSPVAAVATAPYAAGRAWARHTITTVATPVGTRYRKLTRTASKSTYKRNSAVTTVPAKSSSNFALTSSRVEDLNRLSDSKVSGFRRTPHSAGEKGNPSRPTDDQMYKDCTLNVTYFDPDSLADCDFDSIRGVSSQPTEIISAHIPGTRPPRKGQPSSILMNAVSVSPAAPSFRLARPTTRYALRKNLIYLVSIRRPTPSLTVLVDYHASYPDLQTTWSYNLLIALALRHVSFGVTQMLFTEMRRSKIKGNFETWKLQVRSLIQAGFWDRAWRQVMETFNSPIPGNSQPRHEMPLPIWLEFCRSLRKGILRKPPKARWIVNEQREVMRNAAMETVTEGLLLYRARQRLLFRHRPTHMPDLATTQPNIIYHIVYLLLQSQQGDGALLLTTSYLRALPRKLRKKIAMRCLDIIHLHITFNQTTKGLRKLYETRKTLNTLLKLHRSLRPTSSTLFLLLSTLRHAKRCGTVANNVVRAFKTEWGPQVEDGRVRRRMVALALKEGRRDLVKHIGKLETEACRATKLWTFEREVLGGTERWPFKRVFRYPGRKLFVKNGKERRLWRRVQRQAWLKMGVKIK